MTLPLNRLYVVIALTVLLSESRLAAQESFDVDLASNQSVAVSIVPQEMMPNPAPITDLLSSNSIRCEFSLGYNGMHIGGQFQVGGSTWQGGPIVYHSVNVDAGTARMSGSAGATGALTGEVDVQVTASQTRLHFLGFLPNGTLVVTTVFNASDGSGRHIAVMSRHEGPSGPIINFGAQFIGTCD